MAALFLFSGGALFCGSVSDNEIHQHHALQLVFSPEEFELEIPQHPKRIIRTRAALVAGNVPHRLYGTHPGMQVVQLDDENELAQNVRRWQSSAEPASDRIVYVPERPAPFGDAAEPTDCDQARARIYTIVRSIVGAAQINREREMGALVKDERVEHALRLIGASEDFRVSLADLAAEVGLSESRLVHLFKEQMGLPIRRYALWLRVRRAIMAVGQGLSLTEAAHETGFADQAHFIRSFRDMFGQTPGGVLVRRGTVKIQSCAEGI